MFALMQPAAAVVFALDGILIGALDWGIQGVWVGLLGLTAVRLATLGWRFAGRRWAVTGAGVRAA
jgi:Na+-driven multidrug efflux pump